MPAAPLIDLSTIDLTQIAIDAEEVGRLNPQTGDMRFLDHIIWMNPEGSLCLGVHLVREDEFWIPGHVPGRPLMPAVLMIEAAAQVSSVLYKTRTRNNDFVGFTRCNDAIFRGQVVPGDTLYLIIKEESFSRRRFVTRCQGLVNNALVFEVQVTGMFL